MKERQRSNDEKIRELERRLRELLMKVGEIDAKREFTVDLVSKNASAAIYETLVQHQFIEG